MAQKKPLKIPEHPGKMPDFMHGAKPVPLTNIGPEDLGWMIQSDQYYSERRWYDHLTPLEMLVLAMIKANPNDENFMDRFRDAMKSISGKPKKEGPKKRDDHDEILHEMARRFHAIWVRDPQYLPELAPLARESIVSIRNSASSVLSRTEYGENPEVRRFVRAFKSQIDELLVRVTSDMDHDRLDVFCSLKSVADILKPLGIKLDVDVFKPWFLDESRMPKPKDQNPC